MSTTALFRLAVIVLLSAALGSCKQSVVYEETFEIDPQQGWPYADSLTYAFSIADTQQLYNLYLTLDHLVDYPYQNLYINIRTVFPDGKDLAQVLSLELSDKQGFWQGDCNSEDCELRIPIQEEAYFNQPGDYRIVVEQYMRTDSLRGLQSIGLQLEKTGETRG
jgi:gliding motility-associated lipoprotein GldH